MNKERVFFSLIVILVLSACASSSSMILIPRSGGQPLKATNQDKWGQTKISVALPSGEMLQGNLIWIPPGGGVSTAIVTTDQGSAVASGMASGSTGKYAGSIVGDRGTTMRIELLCNTWTGKCIGAGQTSTGIIYDIQR